MEAELRWNLRVGIGWLELTDMDSHTVTRESQEVWVGVIVIRGWAFSVVERVMLSTDIPHSGQLNITILIPRTPVYFCVSVNLNEMSVVGLSVFIVSS